MARFGSALAKSSFAERTVQLARAVHLNTVGKAAAYPFRGLAWLSTHTPGISQFLKANEHALLLGLLGPDKYKLYTLAKAAEKATEAAKALGKGHNPATFTEAKKILQAKLPKVISQDAAREAVVSGALSDLHRRSNLIAEAIRSNPEAIYDRIIVGGGIHGVIYASNLKKANPKLRVLVIEAGNTVSTPVFGNAKRSFHLNSKGPANIFPNSPVQITEWTKDRVYPFPLDLRDEAVLTAYFSDVDIMFNTKAIGGVDHFPGYAGKEAKLGRYSIKTNTGLTVRGTGTDTALGFGKKKSPFKDAKSNKLFYSEGGNKMVRPTDMPDIQCTDELLQRAADMAEGPKPVDPLTDFKDKTIIIIGGGNGGDIAAKFHVGLADKSTYINPEIKPGKGMIVWIGQKSKTGEEYKRKAYEVYHNLAPSFDDGTIVPVDGRAYKVRRVPDGPDKGRLAVYIEGQATPIIGDKIESAVGYEDLTGDFLKAMLPEGVPETSLVYGQNAHLGPGSVPIAKKLEGHEMNIIGPSAGLEFTPEQLAHTTTKNPVSIDALAFGTADLAIQNAARLKPAGPKFALLPETNYQRLASGSFGGKYAFASSNEVRKEIVNRQTWEFLFRSLFADTAKGFKFPSTVDLVITKVDANTLQIASPNLNTSSTIVLGNAVRQNSELVGVIENSFHVGSNQVVVKIPILDDGVPDFGKLFVKEK